MLEETHLKLWFVVQCSGLLLSNVARKLHLCLDVMGALLVEFGALAARMILVCSPALPLQLAKLMILTTLKESLMALATFGCVRKIGEVVGRVKGGGS